MEITNESLGRETAEQEVRKHLCKIKTNQLKKKKITHRQPHNLLPLRNNKKSILTLDKDNILEIA